MLSKKLVNIIILFLTLACILFGALSITYAVKTQDKPDYYIWINNDGSITKEGNLFSNQLWYPGKKESGIIRISNDYKSSDIRKLGLKVSIDKNSAYESFLDNMELTIQVGKLLIFNEEIISEISIGQLQDTGIIIADKKLFIEKGDSIDLKYILHMNDKSGNELEDISSKIELCIDMEE